MDLITEIKNSVSIKTVLDRLGIAPNSSGKIPSIYHKEKTPSTQIYFNTNSFYDFSTSTGGDIIKLYQDFHRIETKEAIKELAQIGNISQSNPMQYRERIEPPLSNKNEIGFELLQSEQVLFDELAGVYEYERGLKQFEAEKRSYKIIIEERKKTQIDIYKNLFLYSTKEPMNKEAHQYLTGNKRGLSEGSLKQFKIFAINEVKKTIEFLKENYSKDELLISGLFTKKHYFIFSKHQIVIPFIENENIVYLRGRYFYNGEAVSTDGFGKYIGLSNFATNLTSKRFYNIDILKTLPPHSNLTITEGEFDCMVANQNNVASIGISGVSSFPKDKINELKFYSIYLAFDSDAAGTKASYEIAGLFKNPVKIIKLNNYKDLTELMTDGK